ncbi:MAG: hypothetical protein WBA46_04485 [Thermomicrobiales bacterium]
MLDTHTHPAARDRTRPGRTSPWMAVGLTLGSAAILGTIAIVIWGSSVAWWGHGLAVVVLVLAAGMALGSHRWQRRGRNLVAWAMGFSLGLTLITIFGVGLVSLIAVIFLGAALMAWPRGDGEAAIGWTQVWCECLGFLCALVPLLMLISR